jgi:hypothetical protein
LVGVPSSDFTLNAIPPLKHAVRIQVTTGNSLM